MIKFYKVPEGIGLKRIRKCKKCGNYPKKEKENVWSCECQETIVIKSSGLWEFHKSDFEGEDYGKKI